MAAEEYVILTLRYEREGNKWVGVCEELSTSTYARTLKQCQKELEELVTEHLHVLESTGQREAFFQKWGVRLHRSHRPPTQFTIRVSNGGKLLKPSTPAKFGPFLQPRRFPIPRPSSEPARMSVT